MPDDSVNLRAQSTDVDVSSITLEEKEMDKAAVEELAPGSTGTPQEGQGGGGPTTATWEAFFASVPGRGCVLYCLIYTALGLCLSTFGPVILDLSVQTGGTLRETGYCLIIRSLGYLGGSFFFWIPEMFVICIPDGYVQLHALFHITSAIGAYSFIVFATLFHYIVFTNKTASAQPLAGPFYYIQIKTSAA